MTKELYDLDKIKLRTGYVFILHNPLEFFGVVKKVNIGYEHFLNRKVVVNTKPSDVFGITDPDTGEEIIICSYNRIVAWE